MAASNLSKFLTEEYRLQNCLFPLDNSKAVEFSHKRKK